MKYILKYQLENMPELVLGEVDCNTPFQAGIHLQDQLKSRIGEKKFELLRSAKIVDEAGNDKALLQIDVTVADPSTKKVAQNRPHWGAWLTIR